MVLNLSTEQPKHERLTMNLQELASKKAEIERRRERLLGKLESSRATLAQLDSRLTERGINPESLKEEITRLETERDAMKAQLEEALSNAEEILSRIESRVESL